MASLLLMAGIVLGFAAQLSAEPPVHYQHGGIMPPGSIGSMQLERGGPLPGYMQPVEIKAPPGALISMAVANQFGEPQASPVTVGLLIAPVYRMRITNIPVMTGHEVYPTVELVNRLYSPVGMEARFPVPIEITQADLELALNGKFVTRVIYLENPEDALPVAQDPTQQHWFEIAAGQDPLEVADRLGRPMAILRIGGRVPEADGVDPAFMFGSPPFMRYAALPATVEVSDVPTADQASSPFEPWQVKQ